MNLTTIAISGLAVSIFAAAVAVRATEKPQAVREAWRFLPPASPTQAVDTHIPIAVEQAPPAEVRVLKQTYQRTVRKDDQARQDVAEALDEMRHARRRLAESPADDDVSRSHWQRSYRAANLRLESANRVRRRALLSIDETRSALRALEREGSWQR